MTETRPLVRGVTPPVAVVIVAVLATFVALTVINSSVAIILAIFGGDLLRELTEALDAGGSESTADDQPAVDGDAEDALERLRVRYADVGRYLDEDAVQPTTRGTEAEIDRELERSSGS